MNKTKQIFLVMFFLLLTDISFAQTPLRGTLTLGANIPISDFNNVYKTGVSAEAGILYSLPIPGLDLTLTAGYDGFKYKNEYFTDLVYTNLGVPVSNFDADWNVTDIPIMLGARYKFPMTGFKPYVSGEVGIHIMNFSDRFSGSQVIGSSSNPASLSWKGEVESKTETGFGFAIGAGVEIPVISKLSIDINGKYNYNGITYSKSFEVFRNNNSNFVTPELKNVSYITVRGGVIIDF